MLLSWVNKLIFGHLLKSFHDAAKEIDTITGAVTVNEGIQKIKHVSDQCDFWNIFRLQLGEEYIPDIVWTNLVQFNDFLTDLRLQSIEQSMVQQILQRTVSRSKRRGAGQFSTPIGLASFLASLAIKNKTEHTIDPCCGTGTIARASYEIKLNSGINSKEAIKTTWASDKFSFPVQMATLAMTMPENMGEIMKVFCEDVIELTAGISIQLFHPKDGSMINELLPNFGAIISNLPFVQQEDLEVLNPKVIAMTNKKISQLLGLNLSLDGRSDLYAYLPFALWSILKERGTLGIIISNSWLSTDWGIKFRELLNHFFHIEYIITSGKGRWFADADVVTNILILNKHSNDLHENAINSNEKTTFVTLDESIEEITLIDDVINYEKIKETTALIQIGTKELEQQFTKKPIQKEKSVILLVLV